MSTITERMNSSLQGTLLSAYEWTAAQAVMVRFVYEVDVWYWSSLSAINMCWAVGTLLLVIGLYRFFSVRAAALATLLVVIATFTFGAPLELTEAYWLSASGKPSPYSRAAKEADEVAKPTVAAPDTAAAESGVPADLWSASEASLPVALIGYGFMGIAVIYNTVRLALIPVIVLSISAALIGSLKRRRIA
ncbi:hypothetical protein GOB57_22080 [Sinorhizobium meliloti]|nr:hypothetical protein [Sinorhizobium meliloti]